MADNSQKISNLLVNQIPDYVQEYYPMFVIFVTKYFEFLDNSSTGVQHQLQNIRLNRDIDTTADEFAQQFLNTYVPNLPNNSALDRSLLVKHFQDFYQTKGSEQSFKFFFKAFFNDDITISYPRDSLFATSDGNWYKETSVRVQSNAGDPGNLVHTRIDGLTSGAYAVVNKVVQVSGVGGNGADYYDLVLEPNSWVGLFTSGETIRGTYYNHAAGTSSQVTTTSVTGVLFADGRYLDSRSQLSNDQLLQDSYYYQQFSYVVKSSQDRETWADHVLKHLHPTGNLLFNEYTDTRISTNPSTSFATTSRAETTVKFPIVRQYLTRPTYTFDRTADLVTGTSTTQLATTTGYTTVNYTSIGAITYDAGFDYSGENITWALQKELDSSSITEIVRFGGASFDKLQRAVALTARFVAWPFNINSGLVTTRYTAVSSNLTADTVLTTITSALISTRTTAFETTTSTGNMLLLLTWHKNTAGNSPAGESSNAVVVSFSSNVSVLPYFDEYTQREYKDLSLNRSLEYNRLIYTHSSNSITANFISGEPVSAVNTSARIVFKPFNWERGLTYDRLAIRFQVDKPLQLNTSLTETFNTTDITSAGLIVNFSSASVSASYFGLDSSAPYVLNSGAFLFNNPVTVPRFMDTREFPDSQRVDVTVRYLVGDGYNGGDVPEFSEDLELQYSLNSGVSWFSAAKLWQAGDAWILGERPGAGTVWSTAGTDLINGNNTLFATEFSIGDVFTIGSSTTTAYTVVNILSNNLMQVTPAIVDDFRNPVEITGTVSTTAGDPVITSTSSWEYNIGSVYSIGDSSVGTTAYASIYSVSDTQIGVAPAPDFTSAGVTTYYWSGVAYFRKLLPVEQQFKTTSLTVYGPGPSTSVVVRIIQLGLNSTDIDTDAYAVDELRVDSYRFQNTTGLVSIGIAVSSNSTLNISDTDFFDITTIGIT